MLSAGKSHQERLEEAQCVHIPSNALPEAEAPAVRAQGKGLATAPGSELPGFERESPRTTAWAASTPPRRPAGLT